MTTPTGQVNKQQTQESQQLPTQPVATPLQAATTGAAAQPMQNAEAMRATAQPQAAPQPSLEDRAIARFLFSLMLNRQIPMGVVDGRGVLVFVQLPCPGCPNCQPNFPTPPNPDAEI